MGRRRGGKFYKSKVGKGEVMVNRTPARLHTLVAPHFLTKLDYGFSGHGNASAAGAASVFSIRSNGLSFPGNTANPWTAAAGGGTLFPATLALNALNPIGMSQLGVIYGQYRCYASKIQLTITPTATSDQNFCLYPSTEDLPVTDFQRAAVQPYAKDFMVSANNNIKQNTIQIYMDNPTIVGYTKQQYNDATNTTSVVAGNPANSTYWNIVTVGTTAAQTIAYDLNVRVTYWLELFDPLPPTDI